MTDIQIIYILLSTAGAITIYCAVYYTKKKPRANSYPDPIGNGWQLFDIKKISCIQFQGDADLARLLEMPGRRLGISKCWIRNSNGLHEWYFYSHSYFGNNPFAFSSIYIACGFPEIAGGVIVASDRVAFFKRIESECLAQNQFSLPRNYRMQLLDKMTPHTAQVSLRNIELDMLKYYHRESSFVILASAWNNGKSRKVLWENIVNLSGHLK